MSRKVLELMHCTSGATNVWGVAAASKVKTRDHVLAFISTAVVLSFTVKQRHLTYQAHRPSRQSAEILTNLSYTSSTGLIQNLPIGPYLRPVVLSNWLLKDHVYGLLQ